MTENKPIFDASGSIKILEESNKCTITALYNINDSGGFPSHYRRLALAICNLQSSIDIFKRMEKELISYLLEELKDD